MQYGRFFCRGQDKTGHLIFLFSVTLLIMPLFIKVIYYYQYKNWQTISMIYNFDYFKTFSSLI